MAASRSAKEWRWEGERRVADRYAQVFGETLERIQREKGGRYEARDVVDAARPKSSPIHPMFEWDDALAAEKHRETQARSYIRSLVVILPIGKDRVVAPAAVSFGSGDGYNDTDMVLRDASMRQRLVDAALKEAESWSERYAHLSELAEAFSAIRRVRAKVTPAAQSKAVAASHG